MKNAILVLWSRGFDEAAAILFITGLRQAGLPVKVVGIGGPQAQGQYGVVLAADVTLQEALTLATTAACIIIPQRLPAIAALKNDPRLRDLFQQAHANGATIIVGPPNPGSTTAAAWQPVPAEAMTVYPVLEEMLEFVQGLVPLLC